jgi:hypothetical protein
LRDNTEVGLVTLTNGHTLITAFSSERNQWMRAKCINIHDPQSPVYALTSEYDGRRAVPKNFFMLLDSYQNHPEAKSLGPDGKACEFDTRGLLQRAHITANWPPIYIGKRLHAKRAVFPMAIG